jgi:DNA-directed RNA polymerase specialized sigma24 family protein
VFRNAKEKTTAQLRWVDGKSIRQICEVTGESTSTVHDRLRMLTACLRQLGINPTNPEKVRDFVGDVLRRVA